MNVKSRMIVFALALATAFGGYAESLSQYNDDKPVQDVKFGERLKPVTFAIGPKVGMNVTMAGNPEGMKIGMGSGIGFEAGVAGNLRFGRPAGKRYGEERFGVQVEALYSLRSMTTDIENITTNNFVVPVLFQWYFIPQLAIETGPVFVAGLSTSPEHMRIDNSNFNIGKIKANDFMWSIGVNCRLKKGFTADVRYNIATTNMASNFRTKVSTLTVGVGWLFNTTK